MQGGDHVLCGWRVRSALPLPELLPWAGPADHPPDITVAAGPVAAAEGDDWVTVTPDGSVRLVVPDLVRMLVRGGREVVVDIAGSARDAGWRLFLLGAAVGCLCHQRGVFPLHAATLAVGGRIVALAGESGAGKSTLAFALTRRGHRLLSDDLTVLRPAGDGIEMLPSFPRLKLWRDVLDAAGQGSAALERVRAGLDKFDLRPRVGFDPAPRRLDAVFVLRKGDAPAALPVAPAAAVPLIHGNVVRPRIAQLLGRQAALFAESALIARRVPVMRLVRSPDFARLEETARLVEAGS